MDCKLQLIFPLFPSWFDNLSCMKSVYRVAFSYHTNLFKGQLGCLLSFMKQMKRNNKYAPRTLFLCTYLYGQVLSVRKFVTQE